MRKNTREIIRKATTLALPMMVQQAISNAVGLVDNIMVGRLGTEPVTGVAIANQLLFVYYLAIFGALAGPGIYGAQFYGKGDTEGVRQTFCFKLLIALGCTIPAILLFLQAGGSLISLYLKGESTELDAALTGAYGIRYLRIMLIGIIPFAITQCYAGSLRETDESIKPMVAGIVSVVVDVILNYILIYGKFGAPALGVTGAALATVTARFAELATIVVWSHARSKKHTFLQGVYRAFSIPRALAGQMSIKGLPIFINELLWSSAQAMLAQCYSTRGLDVVAALNICNAICNLMNVSFVSLGNAVGVITGQYLGSGRLETAEEASRVLMRFTALVSAVFALLLIGISFLFPDFYDTTPEVRALAQRFIIAVAVFFPLQGYLNAIYFTLRSGGKTVITFLFDSGFNWVASVPAAYLLCRYTGLYIITIFLIVQALDIIKTTIGRIMIAKGIWIDHLV